MNHMSALTSSLLRTAAAALLLTAAAQTASARVCVVYDSNTQGCQKGDELLYLPQRYGSDQLPIDFIAKKCDMSKQFAWTAGGVTCIYAGEKTVVEGARELQKRAYAKIYDAAKSGKDKSWVKMGEDSYWRIVSRSQGEPVRVGDRVKLFERQCHHDADGKEHPEDGYMDAGFIDAITKDHYLYQIKAPYGSEIEVIRPTDHGYLMAERIPDRR